MFQNLKVDVVYYNTNTDFEMEFNLCGCCRMRLLTDKALHKRGFVQSLSRTVSRSKVIISVGTLFGDDGIINIASAAIRSKLEVVDNKQYGIDSTETIEIIAGSLPLVTPEGFFGGCIVENGPQTMVLVSDNKNIRKSIMKTLIHPYLEELCANELKEKAANAKEENDGLVEFLEEPISATFEAIPLVKADGAEAVVLDDADDISAFETEQSESFKEVEIKVEIGEPEEEEAEEYGITEELKKVVIDSADEQTEPVSEEEDIQLEGGMVFETDEETYYPDEAEDDEDSDLFVKPFLIKKSDAKQLNDSYFDFENEEESQLEYGEFEGEGREKADLLNIFILVVSVLLLLGIAAVAFFLFVASPKYGISAQETIKEVLGIFSN